MRTISNREFAAHPEMYLDMAQDNDVRIRKGRKMFRLVYETPVEQQILAPDDDLRNAVTIDELRSSAHEHIRNLFAKQ